MLPNKRKILQALNYLASSQDDKIISEMKAYKLLWLADRYHLRQYARTITHDNYYAMQYGVVPSTAKDMVDNLSNSVRNQKYIQKAEKYYYKSVNEVDMDVFSDSDVEVLNLILRNFDKMSPQALSNLSHDFPEWKRYENNLTNGNKKSYKVNINDFFENYKEESGLFVDDDELLSLTKNLCSEMN